MKKFVVVLIVSMISSVLPQNSIYAQTTDMFSIVEDDNWYEDYDWYSEEDNDYSDEEQEVIEEPEIIDEEIEKLNKEREKFRLSKEFIGIGLKDKVKVKVKGTKRKVTFTSSNAAIATVGESGVVTGIKAGEVTITAYCEELNKSVDCIITVDKTEGIFKITKRILKLKKKYPEGMTWTNDNYYYWEAINCNCYGCIAFAGRVSDKIFGKKAPCSRHKNFNKIKPGDHVRIGDCHSVVVISKEKDSITVVEGNYNSSIHWGKTIEKASLKKLGFYVDTRYESK